MSNFNRQLLHHEYKNRAIKLSQKDVSLSKYFLEITGKLKPKALAIPCL